MKEGEKKGQKAEMGIMNGGEYNVRYYFTGANERTPRLWLIQDAQYCLAEVPLNASKQASGPKNNMYIKIDSLLSTFPYKLIYILKPYVQWKSEG